MENNTDELDQYIARAYPRWVEFARKRVWINGLMCPPEELLHEVLCRMLKDRRGLMHRLLYQPHYGTLTALDAYVVRALRSEAQSKRCKLRSREIVTNTMHEQAQEEITYSDHILAEISDRIHAGESCIPLRQRLVLLVKTYRKKL